MMGIMSPNKLSIDIITQIPLSCRQNDVYGRPGPGIWRTPYPKYINFQDKFQRFCGLITINKLDSNFVIVPKAFIPFLFMKAICKSLSKDNVEWVVKLIKFEILVFVIYIPSCPFFLCVHIYLCIPCAY